ncbi:MAG: hypothetical protein AVDCRST_MAG48-712, partial [uncultured Friedmanniella sp.]
VGQPVGIGAAQPAVDQGRERAEAAGTLEDEVDHLLGDAEVVGHQQRPAQRDRLQRRGGRDRDQPAGRGDGLGHAAGGEADGPGRHLPALDQPGPQHVV